MIRYSRLLKVFAVLLFPCAIAFSGCEKSYVDSGVLNFTLHETHSPGMPLLVGICSRTFHTMHLKIAALQKRQLFNVAVLEITITHSKARGRMTARVGSVFKAKEIIPLYGRIKVEFNIHWGPRSKIQMTSKFVLASRNLS